jgi:phenylpropionate dioxygenase-like ring-hydroxylating dioxygenase large terminal subunit
VLTREENEMLTRVGPGTPGGEFQRRYWQPVALAEELPEGGAPVPVRLLGEDLVLFRDDAGRPGLLGIHCAHRGADLSYGRLEDGGLRCIYHGWLYDVSGRCLEQPGEPAGSTFHERIGQTAYPCVEVGGLIMTYMGPGEPPLVPHYEFFAAPEGYRVTSKVFQDCNYLQGNEGNFDPSHLSFLHRMDIPDDGNQQLNARITAPQIEPETTHFGVRIYAIRPVGPDRNYVRVTNFLLPNLSAIAGDAEGYGVNWHVPIDDEHHWRYGIRFNRETPVDRRWDQTELAPGNRLQRTRANRYLQDRESMKSWSFAGLGRNFVVHDTAATESEGQIYDRTQERLGYGDRGIIAMRQVMLDAIRAVQEGRDPPHVIREPAANDMSDIFVRNDLVLPATVEWYDFWRKPEVAALAVPTGGRGRVGAARE